MSQFDNDVESNLRLGKNKIKSEKLIPAPVNWLLKLFWRVHCYEPSLACSKHKVLFRHQINIPPLIYAQCPRGFWRSSSVHASHNEDFESTPHISPHVAWLRLCLYLPPHLIKSDISVKQTSVTTLFLSFVLHFLHSMASRTQSARTRESSSFSQIWVDPVPPASPIHPDSPISLTNPAPASQLHNADTYSGASKRQVCN